MAEFFKQLITQIAAVWQKLSLQQKIVTGSVMIFTLLGLVTLMMWSGGKPSGSGYVVLYSNLETDEAAELTEVLKENNFKYQLNNDGKTILVEKKSMYEARMTLAREGLPKRHGLGYELFDKNNIGMTDFVQKLNARRALEGELQRTIEGMEEVSAARVHIVIPEASIFLDNKKDPTASVMVKTKGGSNLGKEQIRGISHLVSSSVEGLTTDNISIVDYEGRLLSNPYGTDATALATSRNMELQQNIETYLESKVSRMLTNVVGAGRSAVQIAADLDFDQVEKTLEQYNPESRVVRSEERNDESTKNAPDGDHQRERSLTNYEIDKTVERIIKETGNIKRLTISVAVDGRYSRGEKGAQVYEPRNDTEIQSLQEIVKNAVGYDLIRGDQISVANVRFETEHYSLDRQSLERQELFRMILQGLKYLGIIVIFILLLVFLKNLAGNLADAMNPPVPEIRVAGPVEEEPVEVPENVRKTNELLERVEVMTREEPLSITSIIRQWLNEGEAAKAK